jgi:hypothetical protein
LSIELKHTQYTVRRQVLRTIGAAFRVFDPDGQLVLYSMLKAYRAKEDIRLYTGEDMETELLQILARQVIDISATYDVLESESGKKLGALKREGLKSVLKDEWTILDADDAELGKVREHSWLGAILTRLLGGLIPQTYDLEVGDTLVATIKQGANPLAMNVTLDLSPDTQGLLDGRLGIAAAILMCAIEGRQ